MPAFFVVGFTFNIVITDGFRIRMIICSAKGAVSLNLQPFVFGVGVIDVQTLSTQNSDSQLIGKLYSIGLIDNYRFARFHD